MTWKVESKCSGDWGYTFKVIPGRRVRAVWTDNQRTRRSTLRIWYVRGKTTPAQVHEAVRRADAVRLGERLPYSKPAILVTTIWTWRPPKRLRRRR